MTRNLAANFTFGCCLYDGSPDDYIDWHFVDNSPRHALRNWELHYDCERKYFYVTLQRSETEVDHFEDPVTPPKPFLEALMSLLPPEERAKTHTAVTTLDG